MRNSRALSLASSLALGILVNTGFPLQTAPPAKPSVAPSTSAVMESGSKVRPPSAGRRLPSGQTYRYLVDWRLFNAGTASVRLDSANGEQRVVANADSTGAVALLYHLHDRLESFFDPKTNCSLSLTKHTEEGFRRLDTNVRYDYGRHKSVLDEKNLRARNEKHEENEIPSCVTDVVSAVYYVASQPLVPGARLIFPVNDGGKTADVQVTVEAREEIKAPSGTYKTLRLQAEALNGPQKGKGRIWIWYSDDERRLPVQMRARMFWGSLTFHLLQVGPPDHAVSGRPSSGSPGAVLDGTRTIGSSS